MFFLFFIKQKENVRTKCMKIEFSDCNIYVPIFTAIKNVSSKKMSATKKKKLIKHMVLC